MHYALVRSDPGIAHGSLRNQMKDFNVKRLREFAAPVVIIIDALDECRYEEFASAILPVLRRLLSDIPKVMFPSLYLYSQSDRTACVIKTSGWDI